LRILRNYILSELAASFLVSLGIFTFVLLMGNMIKLAELVITKGIPLNTCVLLFGYMTPYLLSYSIPMSILTGTIITFGRLSSDNEITAMRASGISLFRITSSLILIGLMLSVGSCILNDRVLPQAHYKSRKLVEEIGMKKPAAALEAGTFIKSFKNYIIFVYEVRGNRLSGIRIYQPQQDKPTRTIVAESGEFIPMPKRGGVKIRLEKGMSDEPDPKYPGRFFRLKFNSYELFLRLKGANRQLDKKPKDMTIDELNREIKDFKEKSIDVFPLVTEIHKKIALSFAALAFIFIGVPIALLTKRGEHAVGFGLSLGVIIIYYILMVAAEAISLKGIANPALVMWAPDALLIVFGFGLALFTLER